MKLKIEDVLKLEVSAVDAELKKLNDAGLVELAEEALSHDAFKRVKNTFKVKINQFKKPLPQITNNNDDDEDIDDKSRKEEFKKAIISQISAVVKKTKEKPVEVEEHAIDPEDETLAIDKKFKSQTERLNAIIKDINDCIFPRSRIHELLHENFWEEEEIEKENGEKVTVVRARTFLAFAMTKLDNPRLFIKSLKNLLGDELFKHYLSTPNFIGDEARRKVDVVELFTADFGFLNKYERKFPKITNVIDELKRDLRGNDNGRRQVNFENLNTHEVTSHKSADESHVTAFKMVLESGALLGVEAEFKPPFKEGDPSRVVTLKNRGNLPEFTADQLKKFKAEIDAAVNMTDEQLYSKYVCFHYEEKFRTIKFTELSSKDKESSEEKELSDKRIKGLRFMVCTAQRFMNNVLTDHKCNSGDHPYATDDSQALPTHGLTVEESLAVAYWASKDEAHFRIKPNQEGKSVDTVDNNFVHLIKWIHDMRRGYNIETTKTDEPEENKFPEVVDRDLNRCRGGGINSLSRALAPAHEAYNVKLVTGEYVELQAQHVYEAITKEYLEELKKPENAEAVRSWNNTGKISGPIGEAIKRCFKEKHYSAFETEYKGEVSDSEFESALESASNNIAIPKELKKTGEIESLSVDDFIGGANNDKLPILLVDKKGGGYISTASLFTGNSFSTSGVYIARIKEYPFTNIKFTLFLSKSNLSKAHKDAVLYTMFEQGTTLGDIAQLNLMEYQQLLQVHSDSANLQRIFRRCIEQNYANLLELFVTKICLNNELGINFSSLSDQVFEFALRHDIESVAKLFIDKATTKALDSTSIGRGGANALHHAAECNSVKCMKLLIKKGVNLEMHEGMQSETALHIAAKNGNVQAARLLIRSGADKESRTKYCETPLHIAAEAGKLKSIDLLIQEDANLEAKDVNGQTPFHHTVANKRREAAKLLIKKGAAKNAVDNLGGTVLHRATDFISEYDSMIPFFIDEGVDLNVQDTQGRTAFHCLAMQTYNSVERMKFFTADTIPAERALKIDLADKEGKTALHLAIGLMGRGMIDVLSRVGLLLNKGASTTLRDNKGNNALHLLCSFDRDNSYSISVLKGMHDAVSLPNNNGDTPLHLAAAAGNIRLVTELVKIHGCNKEAKNNKGRTPLHLAANADVVKLLIASGADVKPQDGEGKTPAGIANESGRKDIADEISKKISKDFWEKYKWPVAACAVLVVVGCAYCVYRNTNAISKASAFFHENVTAALIKQPAFQLTQKYMHNFRNAISAVAA